MNNNLKNYINESSNRAKQKSKEQFLFGTIPIYIKPELFFLDGESNIGQVIDMIQKNVPSHLSSNVDVIYVGDFEEFEKKRFNAAYQDGAIYVINVQDNAKDMADDIIHEMAHSLEEKYSDFIYGDGRLQNEFLGKRERLYQILKANGENSQEYKNLFHDLDYSDDLDDYFVNQVGYKKLRSYINGLFYSPYATTSVREYFARGFEAYFLFKDLKTLANLSPVLYNKMENLANME
tara:strand:+ start:307 stop:1011 length:705 start_codon:yes stop_codon:yes gene_type:complete